MKLSLDKSQIKALEELEHILHVRSRQIRDLLDRRSNRSQVERVAKKADAVQVDDFDIANSFGILGPRGAGKSTILRQLHERNGRKAEIGLYFLPPFDCSLVGSDVSPGAAILLHLEKELARQPYLKSFDKIREKLRPLAGLYVAGAPDFRALGAEWASSVGDHIDFILKGIRDRLGLRDLLGAWLQEAAEELGVTAFVVLLDDFDLVHAEEVRRWMLALLDELRQPRLLLVLTADFYRLEHLSLDPEAEFDDKTGRALLGKMLPAQNRVTLDRWDYGAREQFGSKKGRAGQDGGLGQAIVTFGWGRKAQESLLRRLLPGWPRGLADLHARLTDRGIQGRSEQARLAAFLSILASCRAEPLLARELRTVPLSTWARNLRFKSSDVSTEDWQEAVEVAELREHEEKGGNLRPIQLLRPILSSGQNIGRPELAELLVQADLDHSDISGQDSLRHDFLRVKPLRDAQPPTLSYWSELLINFCMIGSPAGQAGVTVGAKHEAVRSRIYFLDHWIPVQKRLSQSVFRIDNLQPKEFRELFLDENELPLSALLWMSWSGKERIHLQIGWPPLLSALRRARRPLERRKMADLLMDPRRFEVEGGVLSGGSPEDLELIPDEIWAIVLLVDALDRCPWRALSGPAEWLVQTYLLLSIALIRSSYVYALVRSSEVGRDALSKDQSWFVQALGSRDTWRFFKTPEEDLIERIRNVLGDGLEQRIPKGSSLAMAAHAFFASAAYTDLRKFALQPQV
jgi:hypothetical protein